MEGCLLAGGVVTYARYKTHISFKNLDKNLTPDPSHSLWVTRFIWKKEGCRIDF